MISFENSIEIKSLSKIYKIYANPNDRLKELLFFKKFHKEYSALNNITFNIKKGETVGIIGKNGAGKSTLLKIISGVSTPTSGSVVVNGEISALLELGTGFNPEYSGIDNIYLNGAMRGFSKDEMSKKINNIIEFADIGDYINQPVKTYSSGMFARLAFSVMISFKPEILIIDEALSVGDVFFQQKCNSYMKKHMQDITKLIVTHDMATIANMADRVFLIENGVVVTEGAPIKVIEQYMKSMHTEVFKTNNKVLSNCQKENINKKDDSNLLNWNKIKKDSVGGAGLIEINCFNVLINEVESDIVKSGDSVKIKFELYSKFEDENVIFGYHFKDKYGNVIFGQNTIGSNLGFFSLDANKSIIVELSFIWPQIVEGSYFLTLGVGNGSDELIHSIQCWAHNIFQINSIAKQPMHGIINNQIDNLKIYSIERS